jgi:hypothetical protein
MYSKEWRSNIDSKSIQAYHSSPTALAIVARRLNAAWPPNAVRMVRSARETCSEVVMLPHAGAWTEAPVKRCSSMRWMTEGIDRASPKSKKIGIIMKFF